MRGIFKTNNKIIKRTSLNPVLRDALIMNILFINDF